MSFKFTATLGSPDSRSLWTRSIYALSTVSDVIKITIRQANPVTHKGHDEVLLTAVNLTKTSSLNCAFRSGFFKEFSIEGRLPEDAPHGDTNHGLCFSAVVNSKTLNVLFRDCGENCQTAKLLLIHEGGRGGGENGLVSSGFDRLFSNKLFIEFETKNDMTKRYSVCIRLGRESFDLRIEKELLRKLKRDAEATEDGQQDSAHAIASPDAVRQLILDTFILRNFLGMFPAGLEDFKIEVFPNARKMILHGFNRQDALSARKRLESLSARPMSLSIQMSLNDLPFENIRPTSDDESERKLKYEVALRLRDFKTFVQLINTNYSSFGEEGVAAGGDSLKSPGTNMCEFLFTQPGDPIVFERKYTDGSDKQCCQVTLITITDGEGRKVRLEPSTERQMPPPQIESARLTRSQHLFVDDMADELGRLYSGLNSSGPRDEGAPPRDAAADFGSLQSSNNRVDTPGPLTSGLSTRQPSAGNTDTDSGIYWGRGQGRGQGQGQGRERGRKRLHKGAAIVLETGEEDDDTEESSSDEATDVAPQSKRIPGAPLLDRVSARREPTAGGAEELQGEDEDGEEDGEENENEGSATQAYLGPTQKTTFKGIFD